MKRTLVFCTFGLIVAWSSLAPSTALSAEWKVGLARADITPTEPIWMAGYASRTRPCDEAIHPLWAKALVIEDKQGSRVVIVGTDLIGFSRQVADAVTARVAKSTGIEPGRIVLNSSHTHCGPVMLSCASVAYPNDETLWAPARAYSKVLQDKLVKLVEDACQAMRPAKLEFGEGEATFGQNRRGRINPDGPVEHIVPVMRVADENGRVIALMFGYACHSTTTAIYKFNGDYSGFTQIALEKAHPGAMAMFLIGCGADTNPSPRGKIELAEQHGLALAAAVQRVLAAKMQPVDGPLCVAFGRVDLPLVDPPSKEELEKRRGQGNKYEQRLTEHLLATLAKDGAIDSACHCPIQVVRFGKGLSMIALSGETVVDYAIRLRKEFKGQRLWIAGYSNDVFAYVPSERVLKEGGYEGGGAMTYFGIHGPFKPGVEQLVIDQVKKLMKQCDAK